MRKNSLMLIFILIGLLGAFVYYNIRAINEEALLRVEASLIKEMNRVSLEFNEWINGEIVMFETTRDIIENVPMELLKRNSIDNPYLSGTEGASKAYIAYEDGVLILGDNRTVRKDYNAKERIWYRNAAESMDTVISDVYYGAEFGLPMITMSAPIRQDGELIGVIGKDVLLTDILDSLKESLHVSEAYAYVMTEDGHLLTHSRDAQWEGEEFDVLPLEDSDEIKEAVLHRNEKTIFYSFNNMPVMAVIHRMEKVDWIIAVAIHQKYVDDEAGVFSRETTIINSLFFIVMLLVVKNLYRLEKVVFNTNETLRNKVYELHNAYEEIDVMNQQLEEKAQKDGLTQVANRGHFDQMLEKYWTIAIREKLEVSIIVMDVDYFKNFNDTYGHQAGDQTLISLCRLVESLIDEGDFFARIGGEEFAILSIHQTKDDYVRLAEGIRRSVEDLAIPHKESPYGLVTISMGINNYAPSERDSMGDFYHQSDMAMYQAKEQGRNRIMFFTD